MSLATAASPSSSAGALGTVPASAGSSWMSPAGAVSEEEPKTREGAAEMVAQMEERLSLVRLRKAANWLSGCLQMLSRASV